MIYSVPITETLRIMSRTFTQRNCHSKKRPSLPPTITFWICFLPSIATDCQPEFTTSVMISYFTLSNSISHSLTATYLCDLPMACMCLSWFDMLEHVRSTIISANTTIDQTTPVPVLYGRWTSSNIQVLLEEIPVLDREIQRDTSNPLQTLFSFVSNCSHAGPVWGDPACG
jgi:hypothetical protein